MQRPEEKPKSLYGTTVEHCDKMIDHSLEKNNTVKFLLESHEKAGCPLSRKFFQAVSCDEENAGGFNHVEGRIAICSNNLILQDEVDTTISHELIHSYDQCRAANLNWNNCAHHACSEIRAANLSGDCHFKRELIRGYFEIGKHYQFFMSDVPLVCLFYQDMDPLQSYENGLYFLIHIFMDCIRRRVKKSIIQNPNCPRSMLDMEKVIDQVWDTCYKDTKPFDKAP
ncbi:hypothetical protein KP509_36G015000 [Ceratopteris richardii]|uniref:Mitochondrial inner membrane protease ATP23 n=1 Tax=Ceratopteris richardii TaxID=49495 RepID=A0A8T2QC48_CERRI|nr:hypothetical protein KP509_36G015000 [Ceratopteris richardii]